MYFSQMLAMAVTVLLQMFEANSQAVCDCPRGGIFGGYISECTGTEGSTIRYYCYTLNHLVGNPVRTCTPSGTWTGSDPECRPNICTICPPAPVNGGVICTDLYAAYSCNDGFSLSESGSGMRMCLSTGDHWSGEAPTCYNKSISCAQPESIDNGVIDGCWQRIGCTLSYSCDRGYHLVGSSTRECNAHGNWSTRAPTCQQDVCPCPSSPAYGYTRGCTTSSSVVTYSCDVGYQPYTFIVYDSQTTYRRVDGDSYKRTCYDGRWSGYDVSCRKRTCYCPCPQPPNNGNTSSCVGNGTVISYSCNTGYNLVGDSSRMCTCYGNWTGGAPICEKRTCPCPPSPLNGYTSGCSGNGIRVEYGCESGYKLVGDSNRTCSSSGVWLGSAPTCERHQCPCPRDPEGGQTSCSVRDSRVVYSCKRSYRLIGQNTRHCIEYKGSLIWSGKALTCEIQCPCPTYQRNGYITGCSGLGRLRSSITYSCREGYTLLGDSTRTCTSSGTWSGLAPKCYEASSVCMCPSSPLYGKVTGCSDRGQFAYYECNSGYQRVGVRSRMCMDSEWQGRPPVCQRECPCPPSPDNGYTSECRGNGTTVSYHCNAGYRRIGSNNRTCSLDGTWLGDAPVCQRPCTCPSPPSSGYINGCPGVAMDIDYGCYPGYKLVGNRTRTCLPNSVWSGREPTCKRITCPCPSSLVNGYTSGCSGNGTEVRYYCNSGYRVVGEYLALCNGDGQWSHRTPICVKESSQPSEFSETRLLQNRIVLGIGMGLGIPAIMVAVAFLSVILLAFVYSCRKGKHHHLQEAPTTERRTLSSPSESVL